MDTYTIAELEKLTVAELKKVADSLDVVYTSKIRKADLINEIDTAQAYLRTVEAEAELEEGYAEVEPYNPDLGTREEYEAWVMVSTPTNPLTKNARLANYAKQNGNRPLTPRQAKRVLKKARHAAANGKGVK